jgi:integrase
MSRLPSGIVEYLRRHEVPQVLNELQEPWRSIVAVAAYAVLRKREVFALERQDVDLRAGEVRVRRLRVSDTAKDAETAVLPIARRLRPHLEAARSHARHPAKEGCRDYRHMRTTHEHRDKHRRDRSER